jgi:hypothetical protein
LQDKKQGADWADIIDISTGEALEITAPTNSVQLLPSAGSYGKSVRGVLSGATGTTSVSLIVYHNA